MKEYIIYDNVIKPNEIIQEVIGTRGFGDSVVKRKKLSLIYEHNIISFMPQVNLDELNSFYDFELLEEKLKQEEDSDIRIIHCFSDYIISDVEKVALTYKKLPYIQESIKLIVNKRCAAIMFCDIELYRKYLKNVFKFQNHKDVITDLKLETLEVEGLSWIGQISNFIQCITGNFDSRFFNSIQGTEYRLRKSSTNKKKIKSEYQYYHMLPENMKCWFVMPFDYQEDENTASYAMERLYMTDIAIKWVHGSIDKKEFSDLLDMYFFFFEERSKKEISSKQYEDIKKSIYVTKVKNRIEELKNLKEFKKIEYLLANNDELQSIDAIFNWYLELKTKVEKRVNYPQVNVIGHGDPCFANAMYYRSTRTLKFIDPKGALCEEDLWTNPYYDIAKLSHSICGQYDFFNNAMFDIGINEKFEYSLSIPFDNHVYKEIFRQKIEENGYDYWSVRLYEASLFLSMLPLHIDYPHKVFGFILNAVNILKEIEENV